MPIYREIYIKKDSKIIIWKITESENELLKMSSGILNSDKLLRYKSLQHRQQYLAVNIILENEGLFSKMDKDVNGKPFIKGHIAHVSISHDTCFAAVMVSKAQCGLDLQSVTDKVLRVKHKYYDNEDVKVFGDEIMFLTQVWSIKEAIYKVHGDPMVYFKEHIRINKMDERHAFVSVLKTEYLGDFQLNIQKIDDVYLTYTA